MIEKTWPQTFCMADDPSDRITFKSEDAVVKCRHGIEWRYGTVTGRGTCWVPESAYVTPPDGVERYTVAAKTEYGMHVITREIEGVDEPVQFNGEMVAAADHDAAIADLLSRLVACGTTLAAKDAEIAELRADRHYWFTAAKKETTRAERAKATEARVRELLTAVLDNMQSFGDNSQQDEVLKSRIRQELARADEVVING